MRRAGAGRWQDRFGRTRQQGGCGCGSGCVMLQNGRQHAGHAAESARLVVVRSPILLVRPGRIEGDELRTACRTHDDRDAAVSGRHHGHVADRYQTPQSQRNDQEDAEGTTQLRLQSVPAALTEIGYWDQSEINSARSYCSLR